jgi:hypothetical protein
LMPDPQPGLFSRSRLFLAMEVVLYSTALIYCERRSS